MNFLGERLELVGECWVDWRNSSGDRELPRGFVGGGCDVKVRAPKLFPLVILGILLGPAVVVGARDGIGAAITRLGLADLVQIGVLIRDLLDRLQLFFLLGGEVGSGFVAAAARGLGVFHVQDDQLVKVRAGFAAGKTFERQNAILELLLAVHAAA